jgi:hypothetical protein
MIVTIYSVHPKSIEVNSILDKGGSKGNYAIFLPSFVKSPSSSKADK